MENEEKKEIGTLIKTVSFKRKILNDRNNLYDSLVIFYRDKEGKKVRKFIGRAEVPYYFIKDRESDEALNPPMFIPQDKVEKFTTFSDNLFREIATKADILNFYNEISMNFGSSSYNLKNILKHPYVYDADMDISDRYIQYFNENFQENIDYKLKKSFFDIEVDTMPDGFVKDSRGVIGYQGFPDEELAPCPVSLISFFYQETKTFYCFIIKNEKNESQKEFFKNIEEHKQFLKKWIKEEDDEDINDIIFLPYETEAEGIVGFFDKVHELDPDFCAAWNAGYDCQTLQNRLEKLRSGDRDYCAKWNAAHGKNFTAKEIAAYEICDANSRNFKNTNNEDIEISFKPFFKQQKEKLIVDRTESYSILDGVSWFDQMGLFASIRKTSGQRESYSLDAISMEELDKEKLPFAPGETIKNLPWKNFFKFVHYNIVDVLRCYQLEKKNLDLDMLQRLSEITNTRKEKVFKKTISLKNFVSKFARQNNFIMNNNKNSKYGSEEIAEKFKNNYINSRPVVEDDPEYLEAFNKKENYGAFVGDPLMNAPEGIEIFGKKSQFIFENVGDQDFASLYPSIIRALNLDPTTQVGKFFLIDSKIKENLIKNFGYDDLFVQSKNDDAEETVIGEGTSDLGPTLVDSLQSQNWEKIGKKYFFLPTSYEIIKDIKKEKNIKT